MSCRILMAENTATIACDLSLFTSPTFRKSGQSMRVSYGGVWVGQTKLLQMLPISKLNYACVTVCAKGDCLSQAMDRFLWLYSCQELMTLCQML